MKQEKSTQNLLKLFVFLLFHFFILARKINKKENNVFAYLKYKQKIKNEEEKERIKFNGAVVTLIMNELNEYSETYMSTYCFVLFGFCFCFVFGCISHSMFKTLEWNNLTISSELNYSVV